MSNIELNTFRDYTVNGKPLEFYVIKDDSEETTDSIKNATHIKLGAEKIPLDSETKLYIDDKPQSLRAVVFCWLHDKSSIVDYKNECLENNIPDFKFLVKTELTTWLNGNSDTCSFIKEETTTTENNDLKNDVTNKIEGDSTTGKKHKLEDPQLERITNKERESIDHNEALRGSKNIDFGYLISDAKRFINQLKRSKPSSHSKSSNLTGQKKQPIIIVSPATTALLSLSNIKEFLEDGTFIEPSASRKQSGIVTIRHEAENLIPSAHQIMVVDNVDLFTKPEYWDRVVAIFTTGQTWQFAKYKYSKPELLFQKYAGYYVSYQGDVTPKQIKDWNIHEIKVDRGDKRFRDKMIVKDFWADIDKILISKGYGAN